MKFNKVITEALIDDLGFSKGIKNVLKYINTSVASINDDNYLDVYLHLKEKFSLDTQTVAMVMETYLKFGEYLFKDAKLMDENIKMTPQLLHVFRDEILSRLHARAEEVIYNEGYISVKIDFWEGLDFYRDEDSYSAQFAIKLDYSDFKDEFKEKYDPEDGVVWCTLWIGYDFLYSKGPGGYDFISNVEGTFWDYLQVAVGNSEAIDGGRIKSSYMAPPEYFSESSINGYVEKILTMAKKIVLKNKPILDGFRDHLEHGGSLFEKNN
jgi:hypothetical protein